MEQERLADLEAELLEKLSAEREVLFGDLREFGQAVGHISIKASSGSLLFRYKGRELRFDAKGKGGRVDVSGSDVPKKTQLFIQSELEAWVVKIPSDIGQMEQELLFDKGLEGLMQIGLELGE
jgi:hypothetical protein